MNKVRTIVIDGVEIQTSLSAVEIASLPIKCAELEQENKTLNQKYINAVVDYEEQKFTVEELKKQLEVGEEQYNDLVEEKEELQERLTTYQILLRDCEVDNLKNISKIEEMEYQQKEFIEYLENEKDRLSRECSQIYEDSLGKTRLVNEDIFNEVDKALSKYKEIIGNDINVGSKGGKNVK